MNHVTILFIKIFIFPNYFGAIFLLMDDYIFVVLKCCLLFRLSNHYKLQFILELPNYSIIICKNTLTFKKNCNRILLQYFYKLNIYCIHRKKNIKNPGTGKWDLKRLNCKFFFLTSHCHSSVLCSIRISVPVHVGFKIFYRIAQTISIICSIRGLMRK